MRLIPVTAPPVYPVTLAEARTRLRVDAWGSPPENPEDDDITLAIAAATGYLDGPTGILGRALVQQTWDLTLDGFPRCIEIPLPPLQSVDSVSYLDSSGAAQTLAATEYQVVGAGGSKPARIVEAYNKTWPATRTQPEAVTVRFTAGYAAAGSPPDYRVNVPPSLKMALFLLVGHFYANREEEVTGNVVPRRIEMGVKALTAGFRLAGAG